MLPYKLDTTNDLLTSRAGLICIAQVMEQLNLAELVDQCFTRPNSNRGFNPSVFIQTLILIQYEGSFHLEDVRHLNDDEALREILELKKIPKANTLGEWLRKMGKDAGSFSAWQSVNKVILKAALHHCKAAWALHTFTIIAINSKNSLPFTPTLKPVIKSKKNPQVS